MNERIREFAIQSGILDVADRKYMTDAEKFAELIIQECAKFCDEVINESEIAMKQCEMVKTSDQLMMLHDGTRNGAQMSKNRFKKHFGVEL